MIQMGVIGFGYWGPKVARNFNGVENVKISALADKNPQVFEQAKEVYSQCEINTDYRRITTSPTIDAVAIATPVFTHFDMAKSALENGKHVFVEKPFTFTASEAEKLIELAEKNGLTIMVDHTFLFTGAVRKIKEIIDDRVLGHLYYYDSTRVNLGLFQHDVNVIMDLAPHDFSIMDYVINEQPEAVTANGVDHFDSGLADVAYVTVYCTNSMIAHFNVNWLSPVKIRSTLIGGDKKMLVWNDLEADDKIKIYDKGVFIKNKEGIYKMLIDYRSGDMWSPRLDRTEALRFEAEYFVDCVLKKKTPINDGHAGLRVVKMLEAANESLQNEGKMVRL